MLKDGETLGTYVTQGQAPFLINAGVNYANPDIQTGIFYNVQGRTLGL